ncbi:MAG: flagellar basal body P-ring formation protein FlgA [Cytophagales bacterium]|nr:flagellar basal body P-ring formation protein FlgA [Rhizobacter sp.]
MPRVEVLPGRLDARLRLTPCEQIHTYLPGGARLWGKTRVGLRCVKGVTPWNVYMPVTVNVFGNALVSTAALPAGHVLAAADFRQAEVNLTEDMNNPPITDGAVLLGRTLAKPLAPGQGLRQNGLKARQWFAAGDRVQIRVAGQGFAVAGAGEAVTAGMEGQPARVRTESGRTVSGMPVAERQLEIAL